jgi:DNA-binding transcriptional LysR family regulator
LDIFVKQGHVLFDLAGVHAGCVDTVMWTRGLTRRIALRSPHILSACAVVSNTDLLLSLPSRVAEHLSRFYPLEIRELPFEIDKLSVSQVWHQRLEKDSLQRWLRTQIAETADGLAKPSAS